MQFEDRKEYFLGIARTGGLYIDLARDRTSGRFVGYCVSSISAEKNGEIESIFVEDQYRSAGIGSALMKRALTRMDDDGVARKRVSVGTVTRPQDLFTGNSVFIRGWRYLSRKTSSREGSQTLPAGIRMQIKPVPAGGYYLPTGNAELHVTHLSYREAQNHQ